MEARGGIEPPIKVLQTFALPLGDRASEANLFYHFTVGQPRLAVYFRPAEAVRDSQEWLSYQNKSRGATFRSPRCCEVGFAGLN